MIKGNTWQPCNIGDVLRMEGADMFGIGDCIAYPLHGAGYVESIETKEILGAKKQYYVLRFVTVDAKVMVPVEGAEENGLRALATRAQGETILVFLAEMEQEDCENWNRRYRENLEKMRTGNIYDTALVVRRLSCRYREKGLSGGELKMLHTAQKLLVGELMISMGLSEIEMYERIEMIT
jgi:CarD family transcriptional regulator